MMNNNAHIRVERGSFKRPQEEQLNTHQISPTTITSNANNMLLLSSCTTLCKEPLVNTQSQYNNPFYEKSNILMYQKKFQSVATNKRKNANNLYSSKLLQKHISFTKLIIFDFDDTLFPTSSISRKQLKSFDSNPSFSGETKSLYYNIKSLIQTIISLFNTIKSQKNTEIYIVTNASYGWIDGLFSGYFSGVIGRLFNDLQTNIKTNNINIISARDKYNHKYVENTHFNGAIAKMECMESIFSDFKNRNKDENVSGRVPICYCIGDGLDEFNASKIAWEKVITDKYISILQRIKFMERPSIELLMEEIKTIESLINDDTNEQFIEWILNKKYIIDYV